LLALVILAALPAAALAVAPNQNTLAEFSQLLEQSRRAPRPEARAERTAPTPSAYSARIKPAPIGARIALTASLDGFADPLPGGPNLDGAEPQRRAMSAMVRAGRVALPPPAR